MNSEFLVATCLFAVAFAMGCSDSTVTTANSSDPRNITPIAESNGVDTPVAAGKAESDPNSEQESQEPAQPGILDRASDLYNKSKQAGAAGNVAKKWLSDKFQDAGESGSETAEETAKWANDTYELLKQQGLTSATTAGQWLSEDIRNMNAWQYKVVRMSWDDPEETEKQMNNLGKKGWECFHVADKDGRTVFFFKKSKKSYLKNIPVKDMLRLLPLMGGDDEG